jgi:hypothetical protein
MSWALAQPIMAHAEIGVQDNAIDAIVAAAQQILTVLPSLYCWHAGVRAKRTFGLCRCSRHDEFT